MDNKEITTIYTIKKLVPGGLCLHLQSFDMTSGPLNIEIAFNETNKSVPRKYALNILQDGTLKRMYEEGYFTVEPKKEFEEDCKINVNPDIISSNLPTKEEIKLNILKGNVVKLKSYFELDNTLVDDFIFDIVKTEKEEIKSHILKLIKDNYKTDFFEEEDE